MTRPAPAAALTVKRPPAPITSSAMATAMQPLLELLGLESADDVSSVTITAGRVRVNVVPRHRGRRQHDALVRVSYPIVFDGDQ